MSIKSSLEGIVPEEALKYLSGHFEVTGDIALIQIPPECLPYREEIADKIMSLRKDVITVIQKTSPLKGENRVGCLELIKGVKKTETIHKEAGYLYKTDLSKVFFTPKLSYERMRIASQIRPNERIIVPFCGAGPFAIPAADKGLNVVGVEKNPDACRYFRENLKLNGLQDKGDVICGDALFMSDLFSENEYFSRAVIPTAYGMDEALFKTAPLVKKGGIIHFYTFKTMEEIAEFICKFEKSGLKTHFYRRCGNIAPGVYRFVFDLLKEE
ncbi:MAG: hypothetical protein PHV39_08345 [Methanomicrobium sp.]|nr:hypothetical protein [Methanomicrobium sp.]